MNKKDLRPGIKVGRLTLIRIIGKKSHRDIWECRCECGNTHYVEGGNIGRSVLSCGCLYRETHRTHGESKTRLYKIWADMKARCYNPNEISYKHYGARGISMCEVWRTNYQEFSNWARTNGYRDDLTIDRINNDLGYSPQNCRWVSYRTQANNRSVRGEIKYHGIAKDRTGYRAQVTVHGEKIYIAHSVSDIGFLIRKRNEYIETHNLPNKKNPVQGQSDM